MKHGQHRATIQALNQLKQAYRGQEQAANTSWNWFEPFRRPGRPGRYRFWPFLRRPVKFFKNWNWSHILNTMGYI